MHNLHAKFNEKFVLESLKLILKNNVCKFNGECFIKINGTAMGTILTPAYPTLSMGYLELIF